MRRTGHKIRLPVQESTHVLHTIPGSDVIILDNIHLALYPLRPMDVANPNCGGGADNKQGTGRGSGTSA